jgi:hypothetical protein
MVSSACKYLMQMSLYPVFEHDSLNPKWTLQTPGTSHDNSYARDKVNGTLFSTIESSTAQREIRKYLKGLVFGCVGLC